MRPMKLLMSVPATLRPSSARTFTRRVGDDALAAVAGHVVVDAALERAQQRRLAVEPAADDERDARGMPGR
jgi:predicted kinase